MASDYSCEMNSTARDAKVNAGFAKDLSFSALLRSFLVSFAVYQPAIRKFSPPPVGIPLFQESTINTFLAESKSEMIFSSDFFLHNAILKKRYTYFLLNHALSIVMNTENCCLVYYEETYSVTAFSLFSEYPNRLFTAF